MQALIDGMRRTSDAQSIPLRGELKFVADLGFTSLELIGLVRLCEQTFGVTLVTQQALLDRIQTVDQALQAIADLQQPRDSQECEAAASLLRIWREILSEFHPDSRTLHVDLDTNIFEAGATSMLVMMFIGRIYDEFGVELPFDAVLQRPTIGGLARRLSERISELTSDGEVP